MPRPDRPLATSHQIRRPLPRPRQSRPTASTAASSSPSPRPGSTAGRAARRSCPSAATSASIRPRRPRRAPAFAPACAAIPTPARLAGVEPARRRRGARDGADRRRRRRPRGRGGLARRLAYSERQLTRQLTAELGAGPLALARAQRAQTARILIETSDLRLIDVAYAAGFASVRQFNDTIRASTGAHHELRRRRPGAPPPRRRSGARRRPTVPVPARVRLAFRPPLDWGRLLDFLAARARRRRRGGPGWRLPAHTAPPARPWGRGAGGPTAGEAATRHVRCDAALADCAT